MVPWVSLEKAKHLRKGVQFGCQTRLLGAQHGNISTAMSPSRFGDPNMVRLLSHPTYPLYLKPCLFRPRHLIPGADFTCPEAAPPPMPSRPSPRSPTHHT